jgi:hypothetical protein
VSLFRRGESLHVRLAREGAVSLGVEPEPQGRPSWDAATEHGGQRPREWDLVTAVDAPELHGERAAFVALSRDELVVEDGPGGIGSLAQAVERGLEAPYRAEAVRRHGSLWAVAARAIHVVELPGVAGEEIELTLRNGARTLLIDGQPAFGSIPTLERPEHVVRARRIDGAVWEVRVDPL